MALVVLSVLALAFATGCVDYEERISFDRNGAGTYDVTVALDRQLLALGEADLDQVEGPIAEAYDRLTDGLGDANVLSQQATVMVDGHAYQGLRLRMPFHSREGFNAVARQIGATPENADPNRPPAPQIKLNVQGDTYTLTATIAPAAAAPAIDDMVMGIMQSTRRVFVLILPGQVTAANADARNGQTYTWNVDMAATTPRQIVASWKPAGNPALSANPKPLPAAAQ